MAATGPEFNKSCKVNEPGFPIHINPIPALDLGALDDLALKCPAGIADRWLQAKRVLTDPTLYSEYAEPEPSHLTFDHTDEQLQRMLDCNVVGEHLGPQAMGWVRKKGALELRKSRWRCIDHTITMNKAPRTLRLHLNSMDALQQTVHHGSHGIVYDYKSYFHAFEYHEEVKRFACFRHNGRLYHLNRLAMGQSHACDVAHTASIVIAHNAVMEESRLSGKPPLKYKVHIDNGLLVGPPARLRTAYAIIERLCERLGVIINDENHEPQEQVDFAGCN